MNAGDSKAGRLKASITRRTRAGINPTKANAAVTPTPNITTKISEPVTSPPNIAVPKTKPYKGAKKFLGSFKYGGHVQRTGLYLLHKNEHVKSPFKRGGKGMSK